MKIKHFAVKIRAEAVDCLENDEDPTVSEGVISDMLTEFESEKVKELQDRLDEIIKYADGSYLDDISKKACDRICDIANGETE